MPSMAQQRRCAAAHACFALVTLACTWSACNHVHVFCFALVSATSMRNSRKLSVEPATRHNRNRRTAALSSTDWSIPGNCTPFLKSLSERPDHAGDRPYEYPQQHSSTCVLGDGRHVEVLLRSYCDHRRAGRRAGASPQSAPPPASKALSQTVCTLAAPRRQAVRTDRISCKNCAKLSCAERRSLIDRNSRTHSCKPLDDSMGAVRHGATLHRQDYAPAAVPKCAL